MRHRTGNEIAHDSRRIHGDIVRSHDIIRRRLRTVTLIMPPAEPFQGAIGLEKHAGRLLVFLNPIRVRRSTASSDRPIVFASIHRLQPRKNTLPLQLPQHGLAPQFGTADIGGALTGQQVQDRLLFKPSVLMRNNTGDKHTGRSFLQPEVAIRGEIR